MSRCAEAGPDDAGFTLVEVVVALGITVLLLVSTLPQLLGGLRATVVGRSTTQATTLATAELERVRNLPFHVAPSAGPYVDVFDRYFPDLVEPRTAATCTDAAGRTRPLATTSTGYVAASATRCGYEPTGAFYRTVRTATQDPALAGFVLVADAQFLSSATPPAPVTPPVGYSTASTGHDSPAGQQVGVTVTVLPDTATDRTPVTTYTQVARTYATTTSVHASSVVTALEVGTVTADGVRVSAAGGQLTLDASLVAASQVTASLAAASASTDAGARGGASLTTLAAPPDTTVTSIDGSGGQLDAAGCLLVCWGGSHVTSPLTPSTADGRPSLGSPSAPVEVWLREPSAEGQTLRFGAGGQAVYRSSLRLTAPLLRFKDDAVGSATTSACAVASSGTSIRLGASGWVRTTGPTDAAYPSAVDACGTARSSPIAVLPTDFAPKGVVRIRLTAAAARCRVQGTGHTASASASWSATVLRWTGPGSDDYATVATLTDATTTDVLAALDPGTVQVGSYGPLSQWIDSWSAATASRVSRSATGGVARVEVPAVVHVLTQPLRVLSADGAPVLDAAGQRQTDPDSALSVTVGSLRCLAEDHR